ncbi:helix-turn-helix domain-containing protein [uncultured Bacteroides sp.]|uniref:helix-turn-helix domain-containing protein n=1 Tax=uncultured Bacteroides sp. TaxID=162156 RepID=UPI002AAB6C16|nr:helix-turn-helix domain-containing protein [uncultured Bacteroides sp.]
MAEKKIDRLAIQRNCLNGEQLLDNQNLMFLLKVSLRTLQRYRAKGILPYIKLDDGRCYYKATDVHNLIRERY